MAYTFLILIPLFYDYISIHGHYLLLLLYHITRVITKITFYLLLNRPFRNGVYFSFDSYNSYESIRLKKQFHLNAMRIQIVRDEVLLFIYDFISNIKYYYLLHCRGGVGRQGSKHIFIFFLS